MAYDIYGNNLRKGYCEVHPNVHEEYPCSLCYADEQNRRNNRQPVEPIQHDPEKDLKEIAHYYGGWAELRKVIDNLEENDNDSTYERSVSRN